MNAIQLVDLQTQYQKIKTEIDTAVINVLESAAFINGPEVKAFASALENYLGVKHVIPCANGTDALQIALMALGLKAGDEVLTPSFTYIATAEVIALLQLKPVFVEVDPHTFTMDVSDARAKVTGRTKAVIPVHLYGQCAQMDDIMALAREFDLKVVEDTAQALGSAFTGADGKSQMAGCIGDIGTTSFFPSKNLGCYGDGGAMMTNDDELAEKLRMIANHGQTVKYHHDIIGCNSRLDSIQAAILGVKLKYLDEYIRARQEAAAFYNDAFQEPDEIITPHTAAYSSHGFHQYTIKLEGVDRNALMNYLQSKGIPANIYYPIPVHLQKGYSAYGMKTGDMPITEELTGKVLSLPIHTELTEEQLVYIITHIKNFIRK